VVEVEPCADVIVLAAARRSILVDGPKKSAAWRWRQKNVFQKISFDLFLLIENCNKISTQQQWHRRRADKLSAAAARRSAKICGGGAHKLAAGA